ncbi:MAG: formyltransferase family protein [Gemmatimonadota bacterium]
MKVGLLTVSPRLWGGFFARNLPRLKAEGFGFPLLVLDENRAGRAWPIRNKLRRARKQARLAGCSFPTAVARRLAYRALVRPLRWRRRTSRELPETVPVVRVPSANSPAAVDAIRRAACELVCIMDVRILSRRTMDGIGVPIVNVHLSDPRLFRGSQPVLWEVLHGRREIVLTAHRVTEEVDAGPVLEQVAAPIRYAGSLRATKRATLHQALPAIGDLLERVIRRHAGGTPEGVPIMPGPLCVLPSLRQLARAERLCRRRSR